MSCHSNASMDMQTRHDPVPLSKRLTVRLDIFDKIPKHMWTLQYFVRTMKLRGAIDIQFFCYFHVSTLDGRGCRIKYVQAADILSGITLLDMAVTCENSIPGSSTPSSWVLSSWSTMGSCWTSQRGFRTKTFALLAVQAFVILYGSWSSLLPLTCHHGMKRRLQNG